MERRPTTHLFVIVLLLLILGAAAFFFSSARIATDPPPTPDRGLPTLEPTDPVACEELGGFWNTCASACPDLGPDESCIQVCVERCDGLDGDAVMNVYYPNVTLGGDLDCEVAHAVKREIRRGENGYAHALISELLRGPMEDEREAGYFTSIPGGTSMRDLVLEDGVVHVDFSEELEAVAGSCQVLSIRAQIERTLRQLASVEEVLISVAGGDPAEALQP